ncbi:hypothetical protein OV079_40515 [Nannocystis pusilla]|uniref:Uncharacterized protein n=1 Tax=Nannocystis pusilla TaxID=889268 RepID=A0A9X3F521_9BACT|nr:hypothetical protein [Nannocystis pusilla]MCY1011733.1 hypothetical protein [Nannocystis pusilla]
MQAVLTELESLLAGLVERDLPGVLVVACSDVETLYLAQVLARLDERSESDLFLTFTDAAATTAALVDALADNLALQQANLAEQLGPGAALPDLPALARDPAASPATRFHALVDHVLALLPPGDHRLVIALLPPASHPTSASSSPSRCCAPHSTRACAWSCATIELAPRTSPRQ